METHPGEGGMKEKFPHRRKASHRHVCGEFCNLRGQHNWKKKKTKNKTYRYAPNHNDKQRQRSVMDAQVGHQ